MGDEEIPITDTGSKDIDIIRQKALGDAEFFHQLGDKVIAYLIKQSILILGDWDNGNKYKILETIVDKIKDEGCYAITLKELGKNLNDFLAERIAIDKYKIILIVDGKGPGTVSECVISMCEKHLQDKTILVSNNNKKEEIMKERKKHYVYFQKLFFYDMENQDELIETTSDAAVREAHRKALNDIWEDYRSSA